ncbi:hypothetical protein Vadar_025640 [Vaccinium darrowii]|uniref:Uncharacterized protein n=1 Tax=Vaccinium darrowii TaxID=229202 RepID=A0ACB7X3T8_9ERIC|nr:hypothetical protein Vadar_025640 [Vaccinium darrowii]
MAADLKGKVERQVEIKSDGDVFHQLFRYNPHHISTISPDNVHGVDLHEGDWGNDDSVITWNYTHGDLTDQYKDFKATVHVETRGESNTVTWTFEYEKLNAEVEDPNTLMDFIINVSKDIETHTLK